jgi:hypothetical protein
VVRIGLIAGVVDDWLARELPRHEVVEDSEAISAVGMGMIASKLSKLLVLWANVVTSRRSHCMDLQIEPVAISVRSRGMVVNENVVWVGDPNTSGGLIGVEQTPGPLGLGDEILVDVVVSFDGVLDEDIVALDVVDDVLHNSQIVVTVNSDSSVESSVDRDTLNVGVVDVTYHVEMDGVSAHLEGLTDVSELDVAELGSERVVTVGMEEDGSSILVLL